MTLDLEELMSWENLLGRSRISELGQLAAGYAKPAPRGHLRVKGNPHSAYMFARMAAHEARLLFPEIFLWENERHGQQLKLEAA